MIAKDIVLEATLKSVRAKNYVSAPDVMKYLESINHKYTHGYLRELFCRQNFLRSVTGLESNDDDDFFLDSLSRQELRRLWYRIDWGKIDPVVIVRNRNE